ncbi:histidine phosphatase family protein [Rubrobacter calidifluminis]|uniref:histidine phosphatase family protein n=1 Tax=Rubrobacter calidifluminis TaxID=1392640 RepID=UPI002361DF79|nr:histidine phosphatase family protein [Rubrobacter calidifluminis]
MSVSLLRVHLIRHGEISSHKGDVPLTERGLAQAVEAGVRLGRKLGRDESVFFLYAPTRRTRQTACAIRRGVERCLRAAADQGAGIELHPPTEEWALRNPDLYVAGVRVEIGSSPEALAAQLGKTGPSVKDLTEHHFFGEFWRSPDRIGFWLERRDPPGEDGDAVARRVLAFSSSLRDLRSGAPSRRYVCVTHSPLLRAFLRRYLDGRDPGEPDYLDSVDLEFGDEVRVTFRGRSTCLPLFTKEPHEV